SISTLTVIISCSWCDARRFTLLVVVNGESSQLINSSKVMVFVFSVTVAIEVKTENKLFSKSSEIKCPVLPNVKGKKMNYFELSPPFLSGKKNYVRLFSENSIM